MALKISVITCTWNSATYLPESIGAFAYGEEFAKILRAAGFSQVEARPLMFGAVYLYTGQRA